MQRQIRKTTFPIFIAVSILAALSGCDALDELCPDPNPPACMCDETTSTGDTTTEPACPVGGFKHISEKQCVDCVSGEPTICKDLECFDAWGYQQNCCLYTVDGSTVTCPS